MAEDLTLKEVASTLGMHRTTAARLLALGEFPNAYDAGTGIARRPRIPRSDVEAFKRRRQLAEGPDTRAAADG